MSNPFDLPGPEFLRLFMVLMGLVLAASVAVRWGVGAADNGASVASLDAYELAYLAAGRSRVALLVVCNLVLRGAARLSSSQRSLLAFEPFALRLDPIERRVFSHARTELPVARISTVVAGDIAQLRETLQAQELLVSDEGVWLTRAVTLLLFGFVLVAGGIKIGVGVSRGRPVGDLVGLCLVTVVLTIPLLTGPMRTRAGRRVLGRYRRDHPRPERTPAERETVIALWGLAGLYGVRESSELRRCFATGTSGGSGGGWSGGSCGGGHGCGGHGCGGGGCGGGGGGGGCGGCGGGGH